MATFMMSIGRAFSIEPSNDDDYDPWAAHPGLALPAVRQVGRELVETMAGWFENGRETRLSTLGVQVERAMRVSGPDAIAAIAGSPAFAEWAEGASKIDLRDRALADVWQAALVSLQKGGVGRLRVLSVAKKIKPDEASAFRQIVLKRGTPSHVEVKRLQKLGLVRTAFERVFNRSTGFMYLSLFSMACFVGTAFFAMPGLLPNLAATLEVTPAAARVHELLQLPPSLTVVLLGSLLTSIPMLAHIVLDTPELTAEGRELAVLLNMVIKEPEAKPAPKAEATPYAEVAQAA